MTERPNIIFIMADDMGYGDVGCSFIIRCLHPLLVQCNALADVDVYPEKYANGVPESTSTAPCLDMPPEPPLLFNLATDPLESANLVDYRRLLVDWSKLSRDMHASAYVRQRRRT